jgi:hypothetical protein
MEKRIVIGKIDSKGKIRHIKDALKTPKDFNFEITWETDNFVALKYTKSFTYKIEDYLGVMENMLKFGYKFLHEVDDKYLTFIKINQ